MKLYICGNGLDIHHDLNTSYQNYKKWLIENGYDGIVKQYEDIKISGDLWQDIEDSLGRLCEKIFLEDLCLYLCRDSTLDDIELDNDIDFYYRFIFSFTGELFYQWLTSIDCSCAECDMDLKKDSLYVNFNYTNTLEDLYKIPSESVLHIHGDLDNVVKDHFLSGTYLYPDGFEYAEIAEPVMESDKWNNDIIQEEIQFGGTSISLEEVQNEIKKYYKDDIEENKTARGLLEYSSKLIKEPIKNYKKLNMFLENADIDEVIVVGLSIGKSDEQYFQNIFLPKYSDLKWTFYYHSLKNKQFYEQFAKDKGLNNYSFRPYPQKR